MRFICRRRWNDYSNICWVYVFWVKKLLNKIYENSEYHIFIDQKYTLLPNHINDIFEIYLSKNTILS